MRKGMCILFMYVSRKICCWWKASVFLPDSSARCRSYRARSRFERRHDERQRKSRTRVRIRRSFSLPRTLSVECSVRPTDNEPATAVAELREGYERLAPMLLSRAADDEGSYCGKTKRCVCKQIAHKKQKGVQTPALAKRTWKTGPGP